MSASADDAATDPAAAIELDHLTKRYGARRGIEDVTLRVEPGELFGFIGPSGAGKTTTIRALLGLIAPTSGTARLFGGAGAAARAGVGYVPAESHLEPCARAGDLLGFLARLRGEDCTAAARDLAARLELDLDARAGTLSPGDRKKVAIVAALQHAPRLLVLDEPTAGLDPAIRARFLDLLRDRAAAGATVFFASHALAEVEAVCERVGVLADGRLTAIDELGALRRRTMRRVTAGFRGGGSGDALAGLTRRLPGVHDFERHGSTIAFLYTGEVPPLLDALAAAGPSEVRIEEPSLEDVFLHDLAAARAAVPAPGTDRPRIEGRHVA